MSPLFPAISRLPFSLNGREAVSLPLKGARSPGRCRTTCCRTTCCDNGFLRHFPALSRVPLHPAQFLICLSYSPSNLACKWKIIKLSAWQSVAAHQSAPSGRVSLVSRFPSAVAAANQQPNPSPAGTPTPCDPRAQVDITQDPLCEVSSISPEDIYLRPPCHKSQPLQRLTTHPRVFSWMNSCLPPSEGWGPPSFVLRWSTCAETDFRVRILELRRILQIP